MSGNLSNPATGGSNMSDGGVNSQIEIDYEALEEAQTEKGDFSEPLYQFINKQWLDAKYAKEEIEDAMIKGLQNRNAVYDDNTLRFIQENEGGSTHFDPITRTKVRAAEALLQDIFAPYDKKIVELEPTPLPDLPDDKRDQVIENVMDKSQPLIDQMDAMSMEEQEQALGLIEEGSAKVHDEALALDRKEAKERAERMQAVIYDQMEEGGWDEAFADFAKNLVTFKSGFMKLLFRKVKTLKHKKTKDGYKQVVEEEVKMVYEAPSPFDIYPSPNSRNLDDHYFFERMKLTRDYLEKCRGREAEGFITESIEATIAEFPDGVNLYDDIDRERNDNENRPFQDRLNTTNEYEILEYYGRVSCNMLKSWGYTGDDINYDDPFAEYDINAWVVVNAASAGRILKLTINKDPLGRRPYFFTSYVKIPNALWGEGVPDLMQEDQRYCNRIMRAKENNIALASGPQMFVDISRLAGGEELTSMKPYKIWQVDDGPASGFANSSSGDPIKVFQIPLHTQQISIEYNERLGRIDEYTGIPSYADGGPELSGAGGTARGLSMLMNSSSKILRQVIRNIDKDVVRNVIRRMFEYNMLHYDDDLIKGDVNIVPKGALSLIVKEQTQIRLNELLNITNNPTDNQIIDMVHRARLLREIVKDLDLPANNLIPTEEEMVQIQQGVHMQQAQQQLVEQYPLIGMILSGQIRPNGEGLGNLIPQNVPQNNQGEANAPSGRNGLQQGTELDSLDPQNADS